MLKELFTHIDAFVTKYGGSAPEKMKADLMELIQKAADHGADKNQGNVAGIAVKAIKALFGKKED
jgi:hypothetical protein